MRIISFYCLLITLLLNSCHLTKNEPVEFNYVKTYVNQDRSVPYTVRLQKDREEAERQEKRKKYEEQTGRKALSVYGMKINNDKIMTLFVHKFPKIKGNLDNDSYSTANYLEINQSDLFDINPQSNRYDSWNTIEEEVFDFLKNLNLNFTYADIVLTRNGMDKYGNDDYKILFAYRINLEELNKFKSYKFWRKDVSDDQRLKNALYSTRTHRQEEFFDFFK